MISVSPIKLTLALILTVAVLMLASFLVDAINDTPDTISDLFGVGHEDNIPTWYSSVALLLSAILAGGIAYAKKREQAEFVDHWRLLSFIFLFLSVDEVAGIHELASRPVRNAFVTSGPLYFAWVIPGAIFVIVFAIFYVPFLLKLPRQTRLLFLISGLVFVVGALGMDAVNGMLYEDYKQGLDTVETYNKLTEIEELLEMAGIVIFNYALLSYAAKYVKRLEIVFE